MLQSIYVLFEVIFNFCDSFSLPCLNKLCKLIIYFPVTVESQFHTSINNIQNPIMLYESLSIVMVEMRNKGVKIAAMSLKEHMCGRVFWNL